MVNWLALMVRIFRFYTILYDLDKYIGDLACEPAGPLFFGDLAYDLRGPASLAAKNVQCIHTSVVYGTMARNCHQDWEMGNCGIDQAVAKNSTIETNLGDTLQFRNHNACPLFYTEAFQHNFPAVNNRCCLAIHRAVPSDFNMGYRQPNKG